MKIPSIKRYTELAIVLLMYCAYVYPYIHNDFRLDFMSFYSSTYAYYHGGEAYNILNSPNALFKIANNLNPPFFLEIFRPLLSFSYSTAFKIWGGLSFLAGLIAAWVSFKMVFSNEQIRTNWPTMFASYLIMFSTLVNFFIGQVGCFLFFFLISGYYFYRKNNDYMAGILWGIITGIKLFPGLILVLMVRERRYRACLITLFTIGLTALLPLLSSGTDIYAQYLKLLASINWYASNWNASLFGFLVRFFGSWARGIFIISFLLSIGAYWHYFYKLPNPIQRFALTLVLMVLLSPFGWIYYFPMLFLPLLVIWEKERFSSCVLIAFFFINFPIGYFANTFPPKSLIQSAIDSFYFYGLVLIVYLLVKKEPANTRLAQQAAQILTYKTICAYGLLIPLLVTVCYLSGIHLTK